MNDDVCLTSTEWRSIGSYLIGQDVDEGVDRVLELLGRFHGADRAWVIRYDRDFGHFWNTHEWAEAGIHAFVQRLQGIPVAAGAWIHEWLERGEPVMVEDVKGLPRRARTMRSEWKRQGIRSKLAVPVRRGDRLAFQIGYDAVRRNRVWNPRQIRDLQDAAELIASGLERGSSRVPVDFDATSRVPPRVHLLKDSAAVAINTTAIDWIEAAGDYTIVHSHDGTRRTDGRGLKEWECLLSKHEFVRIHRSSIVRAAAIRQLDRGGGNWRVTLSEGGPALSVGRSHRGRLRLVIGI